MVATLRQNTPASVLATFGWLRIGVAKDLLMAVIIVPVRRGVAAPQERSIMSDAPKIEADKELRVAIGWTDIKKREQEVKALVDKAVVVERARLYKEVNKALDRTVKKFIPGAELKPSKDNGAKDE